MVSRKGYARDWDAFITKISHYSRTQKNGFHDDCAVGNGRLGMINGLSREWRGPETAKRESTQHDPYLHAQRQQKLLDDLRWIRIDAELRPYADLRTRALLPKRALHPLPKERQWYEAREANKFFQRLDAGKCHGRTTAQILEQVERVSPQAWAAAHPYGPPVELERINALHKSIMRCRPRAIRRGDPFAMSQERATAIALHILSRIA